jgi:hypothetical protein
MLDSEFSVYQVDETAQATDMMGASSHMNQISSWRTSPARSLVILWFFVLAVYWFLGYFFKGARK